VSPLGNPVARILVAAAFIASIGSGLYVAGSALYFVRIVGLPPVGVGAGLTVAALVGLPLSVPLGHLADRVGARAVTVALSLLRAAALVAALCADRMWSFLVVMVVLGIAENGANVTRSAMVSALVDRAERVRISAFLRTAFNAGFSLGLLAAGIALAMDTAPAYQALFLGNALTSVVACLIYLWLPRARKRPPGAAPARATRDLPYFAVSLVAGAAGLGDVILTVGLPVWIGAATAAPAATAAWLIMLNTTLVVLFQVRAARGVDEPGRAQALLRRACVILAGAAVLVPLTALLPVWAAVAVLVLVVGLLTLGELWGESAALAFRFELAPDGAQGAYGGVFKLGSGLVTAAGPLLVLGVVEAAGNPGWLLTGAVLVVAAATVGPVIRWAERTRPSLTEGGPDAEDRVAARTTGSR
jgi:MFS family permease